jgi:hypothetical protein
MGVRIEEGKLTITVFRSNGLPLGTGERDLLA